MGSSWLQILKSDHKTFATAARKAADAAEWRA